jgi:AsmA protein
MSDKKKIGSAILKVLGILLILFIAALIAVPLLLDANQFRPTVESKLSQALGREVKIGNLKLSLFSGGIEADNIVIADDAAFSSSPFVQSKSLQIGVELRPLIFSRVIRITAIELERPEITLLRSPSGVWNFSTIGGKASPESKVMAAAPAGMDICIGRLNITSGRVTLITESENLKIPHVHDKVEISARDVCLDSSFPFNLAAELPGGGQVKLEGKAGPLDVTDASLTPFEASINISRFDLTASGFIDPAAGLAGLIDFKGNLISDGKLLQSKGSAKADQIQIVRGGKRAARPVSLEYETNYDLRNQSGIVSKAEARVAQAAVVLRGNYALQGHAIVLGMKLKGENMPAQDLEALLPPLGITLPQGSSLQGGTLNVALETNGAIEKMVTTGSIEASNVQLTGFDLGAKMGPVASLAGINSSSVTRIEKFSSDIRISPDGMQISRLSLVAAGLGELSGNGVVGSDSALDFKMLARLNLVGGKLGNNLGIPFFIRGSTANPTFVPDVNGVATSLLDSLISKKDKPSDPQGSGQGLGDTLRQLFGSKK